MTVTLPRTWPAGASEHAQNVAAMIVCNAEYAKFDASAAEHKRNPAANPQPPPLNALDPALAFLGNNWLGEWDADSQADVRAWYYNHKGYLRTPNGFPVSEDQLDFMSNFVTWTWQNSGVYDAFVAAVAKEDADMHA